MEARRLVEIVEELKKKEGIEVTPEFKEVDISEIVNLKSSYYGWDSCVQSYEEGTYYWVIFENESICFVDYAYYYQGYASNHIQDIEEEEDVTVGDYLENAVAVVEYDFSTKEDLEKLNVYIIKPINYNKIKEEIISKLEKIDKESLIKLYSCIQRKSK